MIKISVQISYKKQTVFFLLFLFVIIGSIEGFLRLYDFTETKCKFIDHGEVFEGYSKTELEELCKTHQDIKIDPVTLEYEPNQYFETVTINNYGFRGNDITIEKSDNLFRIFMIGGSTTWGVVVDDHETIPYYLESSLKELSLPHNVEVINAGMSSAWSYNEAKKIQEKLIHFSPDMIIVYDGWNDVSFGKPNTLLSSNYDLQNFGNDTELSIVEKLRSILREFHIIVSLNRLLFYSNDSDLYLNRTAVPFDNTDLGIKVSEWENRWIDICKLGENKNFDVVIIIQPMAGSSNRILSETESLYYVRYDHENLLQGLSLYAHSLNQLDNHCSLTLDFRNVFDGFNQPVYFDQGHLGTTGNKIIAKEISKHIQPLLFK